jgi:hypothetical protein
MSKRFKGKTCVYCGSVGASDTGDHVLAREFVPVIHRGQIPQVPACNNCNGEKASLEHYLTGVLPFGGRHSGALANLIENVPRRLEKNKKLQRELAAESSRVWSQEPSGLMVHTLAVPLDGERLEKLIEFIVRGLMFHHWGVILGKDSFVEVHSLTSHGDIFFGKMRQLNAAQRVSNNIGDGAFVYEAAQGIDNPQISIWQLSFYGAMTMTSADGKDFSSTFGAMTGPSHIKERAEARMAR